MNPIIITKNKKIAKKYFIDSLNYPELNFVLQDLELPKEIIDKHEKIDTSWGRFLTYSKYKQTYTAYKIFNKYYKRAYNDIQTIYMWLINNIPLWNNAYLIIPNITKIAWKKQITINVVFGRWASTRENDIYIGIRPFSFLENPKKDIVLHEMIHANISGQISPYLSHPNETEELIVTLFTRQLIKTLQESNDITIQKHTPDISFGALSQKIIDNIDEFDAMASKAESIFDLARKIDKYFS